jgi:nucleotide-binding universal stress UspA family protein
MKDDLLSIKIMKPYSRVLVGLDLTETDYRLLGFMCFFLKINPDLRHIYFVHVAKDLEKLEFEENSLLHEQDVPSDERLIERMKEEVAQCYHENNSVNIHFDVLEGDPLKQLLHWARVKNIDLIVAGKKAKDKGKGIVMEKFARKSKCSLVFVPENFSANIRKILLAVDFSKRADYVFEKALQMARFLPGSKFYCLHVVDVPVGYTRIGKTYEEFSEIMINNAKANWEMYKSCHTIDKLNVEPVFVLNHENDVAKTIYDYAHENAMDMIILGSKKQTDTAAFFLGSVAEKLVSCNHEMLFLMVRDPAEVYDFKKAMEIV